MKKKLSLLLIFALLCCMFPMKAFALPTLTLYKTPPKVSLFSTTVGNDIIIYMGDNKAYMDVIQDVSIADISVPFSRSYNTYDGAYLVINSKYNTAAGTFEVIIKANDYFDNTFNITINPNANYKATPPTISADSVFVENPISVHVGNITYFDKVTTITLGGKNVDFSKFALGAGEGLFIISSANTTIGTFEIVVKADGYNDAKCNVTVKAKIILPLGLIPPAMTADSVTINNNVVIKTGNSIYNDGVTSINYDGKTLSKNASGFSVNGDYIIIDKTNVTTIGAKTITIKSTSYQEATCSVTIKSQSVPMITNMTANLTSIPEGGGYLEFTITGLNLALAKSLIVIGNGLQAQVTLPIAKDSCVIGLTIPANTTNLVKSYEFKPYLDGVEQNIKVNVTVAASTQTTIQPTIPPTTQPINTIPVTASITVDQKPTAKGVLAITVTNQMVKEAIEQAEAEATKLGKKADLTGIVLTCTNPKVKSLTVQLKASAIERMLEADVKAFTVNTTKFKFSFDNEAINEIDKKTIDVSTVTVSPVTKLSKSAKKVFGKRPVYSVTIKGSKGANLTNLGSGQLTMNIRYNPTSKERSDELFMAYLNGKSQAKPLPSSSWNNGWVTGSRKYPSTFGIGY